EGEVRGLRTCVNNTAKELLPPQQLQLTEGCSLVPLPSSPHHQQRRLWAVGFLCGTRSAASGGGWAFRCCWACSQSLSATEAQWLVSDFCMPEGGWRALRAKVWLSLLYGFFGRFAGLKTRQLPATESHLSAGRFIRTNRKTFCGGMLYSSRYEAVPARE
ncbi:MAG: hypothetical protein NWR36_06775, partial [Opitutales bacterium]|nr:hypothetical protein [Opitutales bacterium]